MLLALLLGCAAPYEFTIDLTNTKSPDDDRMTAIEITGYSVSSMDRCLVYDNSSDHKVLGEFSVTLNAWVDTDDTVISIGCDRSRDDDVPLAVVNNAEFSDPSVEIRIVDVPCEDFLDTAQNCFGATYYLGPYVVDTSER